MMDISVVAATIELSMLPRHFCRGRFDRSETELQCAPQESLPSVKGNFLDPPDGFQFGDIPGDLPLGYVQERGDVPIGHVAFLSIFCKAVDL